MTGEDATDLAALQARLEHEDPVARCLAAKALGRAGSEAAPAVEALLDRLADPDPMVRSMAAAALGKVGPASLPAVDGLVELLRDEVVPVRFWAADALGRIGHGAEHVRRALEAAASDEHPLARPSRSAAALALRALGEA